MQNEEIESYREAGKIASEVVSYAKGFIVKGMKLLDIAENIEEKIIELGGDIAFPTNLSMNEVAAHYTPVVGDETVAEGLLKVDLGVSVNGFIADTAFSLDLSEEERFKEMIELNEKMLEEALSGIKVGSPVSVIGNRMGEIVSDSEFTTIKNLTGHELGEDNVHAGITVSNCPNDSSFELKDIAIAVEPFLTTGAGEVYEGKDSDIFMLVAEGNVRDRIVREVLQFIRDNYKTRPFCGRWLNKRFKGIRYALSVLRKQGIIHNFPVLVEKSKKPVSQAEHTVLVTDKVEITTK